MTDQPSPDPEMAPGGNAGPTATVVGGGPAGLMAAEALVSNGFHVCVFDHMRSVGRKLQLAGRGGLNITHSEPIDDFLDRYGPQRDRLEPALRAFGPAELREWCAGLGEPTFIGSSGRVFPESFRATPLLRAWIERLVASGVNIRTGHRWLGWAVDEAGSPDPRRCRFSVTDSDDIEVMSDVTVLALGGASWPRVGSDGSWVEEFLRCGIDVIALQPANCGVRIHWTPTLSDRFAGIPLKNVAISVGSRTVRGDAMVTESGLEGGPVYALTAAIRGELRRAETCSLTIDLNPDLTIENLTARLEKRRRPKDSMSTWLRRSGFAPVAVALLRDVTGNQLPGQANELARLAKSATVDVNELMPIERAISTAGGVSFDELDESFMIRRMPGVFVAGEMIDWEAPTGGYLLQASFSTALATARGAAEWFRGPD